MATCADCGEPFEKTRDRTMYCGVVCANRSMGMARRQAHPSVNALRVRQVRERLGARSRYHGDPITCAWCGQEFTPERSARLYCSTACSNRANAHKRRGGRPRRVKTIVRYLTPCVQCGVEMLHDGKRKYCSDDCYKQYRHDQHKANYVPVEPREIECDDCGVAFIGKWGKRLCVKCRRRHDRMHRRRDQRIRPGAERRPYVDEEIFERDGYRCHFRNTRQCIMSRAACKADADRRYDDWAPTIDHIIPLASGGSDTPENVACAHRKCNWYWQHRGITQLRFVS